MHRIAVKTLALYIAIIAIYDGLAPNRLAAQVGVFVASSAAATNDLNQPFLLSSVPSDVVESIDDYRRYCQRGQWEKAFKQLEKLTNAKSGLVPDKDGVRVPPSLMIVRLISELPADGKKAFQLFHDADAKVLLEGARGADEEEKLAAVATRFLFSSSGDTAADRWGDLLFERGEFIRAMQAWRSILDYRADTEIARPQLLVKAGIAAARGGRWLEFQRIQREVGERYFDAMVALSGQSVSAVDTLKKLTANQSKPETNTIGSSSSSRQIRLPSDVKPLWQFRWFARANSVLGNREGLVVYDQMYGRQYASDFVPPVTFDNTRVYSDMVGFDIGLELETGKLVWRSGRFFDLMANENQNQGQRNMALERSGILRTKDRVWTVAHDATSQNSNEARYNLIARDLESGKEKYNSKSAKDAARDWIMMGTPVADDEHIYLSAYKSNQATDVYILCLSSSDGKLLWNTKIGSYKNDPRQQFYYAAFRTTVPSLLLAGGALYVETHAGSLVQVNPAKGDINWGINYDSDAPSTDRNNNQPPEQVRMSPPQLIDGVLYFKGMRSRRLYAIDPAAPKVLWSRPIAMSSVLVGADRERIYLGGSEITAYDLKTQKLIWSLQVPSGTGWTAPLLTEDRIYQFSPRGIYEIDKRSGEVLQLLRGSDMDSLGGNLLLTPNALLAVSNVAITAYPIEKPSDDKAGATN